MTDVDRLRLRKILRLANEESAASNQKFPVHLEEQPLDIINTVLSEHVGKISRSINKLSLAADDSVRLYWIKERERHIVTCISILLRMYLHRGE